MESMDSYGDLLNQENDYAAGEEMMGDNYHEQKGSMVMNSLRDYNYFPVNRVSVDGVRGDKYLLAYNSYGESVFIYLDTSKGPKYNVANSWHTKIQNKSPIPPNIKQMYAKKIGGKVVGVAIGCNDHYCFLTMRKVKQEYKELNIVVERNNHQQHRCSYGKSFTPYPVIRLSHILRDHKKVLHDCHTVCNRFHDNIHRMLDNKMAATQRECEQLSDSFAMFKAQLEEKRGLLMYELSQLEAYIAEYLCQPCPDRAWFEKICYNQWKKKEALLEMAFLEYLVCKKEKHLAKCRDSVIKYAKKCCDIYDNYSGVIDRHRLM